MPEEALLRGWVLEAADPWKETTDRGGYRVVVTHFEIWECRGKCALMILFDMGQKPAGMLMGRIRGNGLVIREPAAVSR